MDTISFDKGVAGRCESQDIVVVAVIVIADDSLRLKHSPSGISQSQNQRNGWRAVILLLLLLLRRTIGIQSTTNSIQGE